MEGAARSKHERDQEFSQLLSGNLRLRRKVDILQ